MIKGFKDLHDYFSVSVLKNQSMSKSMMSGLGDGGGGVHFS